MRLGTDFGGARAAVGGGVGLLSQIGGISLGLQAFGAGGGLGQMIKKFAGRHEKPITTPTHLENPPSSG